MNKETATSKGGGSTLTASSQSWAVLLLNIMQHLKNVT